MYLSQSNIQLLRLKVENEGGFQIALAPMQPVLVDDRRQRPKNMFKTIELLGIRHRMVISGRSISAGVCEYKDLQTDDFHKIKLADCLDFLSRRITP